MRIATATGGDQSLIALAELVVISAWPTLMRIIHARGTSMSYSPLHDMARPGQNRL